MNRSKNTRREKMKEGEVGRGRERVFTFAKKVRRKNSYVSIVHTYLSVHLIPGLPETLDTSRAQSNGDV